MSRIESPVETFIKFTQTPGWTTSPEEVLTGDLFSIHNESNLKLNPSHYEEKDGKLWDPVRKQFVAGSAINADKVEENVIGQLQTWFLSHESGIAVQISPGREPSGQHPGYPEEQVTIYRIAYTWPTSEHPISKKILFFTSHQFKANFKNPEELRRFIFTEDDTEKSVFEILEWLREVSLKKVQSTLHNIEETKTWARNYAQQIISGVPIHRVAQDMKQTGFLGDNPIGCGGVTTTETLSYSETITAIPRYNTESWHPGICRICGASTRVGPCNICKSCEKTL